MTSHNDSDTNHYTAMGSDPLGDDDEVLARTLYSSAGGPLIPLKSETPPPTTQTAAEAAAQGATPQPSPAGPRAQEKKTRKVERGPARRGNIHHRSAPRHSRQNEDETKPNHYKVLSISLYNEDIEQMDELVQELKDKGFTRMSRSALIRFALDQVDINKMPRGY